MGSVRISEELDERVRKVAARKGMTRSDVFRNALETYCDRELTPPMSTRFDDIIGVVDVPIDLSTHTRELFGAAVDAKTGRAHS